MTLSPKLSALLPKWKTKAEARRYRRVPIQLDARAIVNGSEEFRGQVINMSPGDLFIRCDGSFTVGDAAVIYIPKFDVLDGTIARVMPDGFALSFRLSRSRREYLAERLMIQANSRLGVTSQDRRAAPRHAANGQRLSCRLADGSSMFVKAVDMSVDAVSVASNRKPDIGSDIHVGRMRGVVLRHTTKGFVVLYDHALDRVDPQNTNQTEQEAVNGLSLVDNPFNGHLKRSA